MRFIGAIALGIAILGAAISSRKSPVPERDRAFAGRHTTPRPELPVDPAPVEAPAPLRVESRVAVAPATETVRPPTKAHDPWRDIESKVELMEDQKPKLKEIVTEREALLKETFGEMIRDGKSQQEAADAVREVFAQFDRKILEQLTGWQQARYLEAREAGTIGRPMLVFQWGSD